MTNRRSEDYMKKQYLYEMPHLYALIYNHLYQKGEITSNDSVKSFSVEEVKGNNGEATFKVTLVTKEYWE